MFHLEKLAYAANDFADMGVALSRSSMVFGDRNLENRDCNSVVVEIVVDGKRVKEGVIGRGWDVVFVFVKRHVRYIEIRGEFDLRGGPFTCLVR